MPVSARTSAVFPWSMWPAVPAIMCLMRLTGASLIFMLLPAYAQEAEAPLFRAGVTLVRVDAQVVQNNGRAIATLSKDDFAVLDEGVAQTISYFGRENEPLDVLLLLDVSGSMRRSLEEMAASASAALGQLHAGDRVAVMLFARRTMVEEDFTSDFRAVQEHIRDAVHEKSLGAGTLINGSIISAAGYFSRQAVKGRRAVLIMTDNEGLNYQTSDEDVLKSLYAADAVLNAIVVRGGRRPGLRRPGQYLNPDFTPSDVFKIAEHSGGEAVQGGRVLEQFPQIIERIRSRYSLQYAAPPGEAGSFRRIRVELTADARRRYPDARIRARGGYFVR